MTRSTPVAIIGAGPYALATGRVPAPGGNRGAAVRRGDGFWHSMPAGMMLRSYRRASNIADPTAR